MYKRLVGFILVICLLFSTCTASVTATPVNMTPQVTEEVTTEPEQPAEEVTIEPEQPAEGVTIEPEQPAEGVTIEPEQPAEEVTIEPEQPTEEVTTEPEQPAEEVTTEPEQPAEGVTIEPEQPADGELVDNLPLVNEEEPIQEEVTYPEGTIGFEGEPRTEDIVVELPDNLPEIDMSINQPMTLTEARSSNKDVKRYTVLVLDISKEINFMYNGQIIYTADTAVEYVKASAMKFVEAVQTANGTNYVAIVPYSGRGSTGTIPFSTDIDSLKSSISAIRDVTDIPNVAAGLQEAERLLDEVTDPDAIKNVIICTTGITGQGEYSAVGKYDSSTVGSNWQNMGTGVPLYQYANFACATADRIKDKATIYTVGLFQTLENMPAEGHDIATFFKMFALDIASSPEHFYDVKDPNDIEFVFDDIANTITKVTGEFKYPSGGRDHSAVYYYDDAYFENSSYVYNTHLATMSLCLELSAWASEDTNDYNRKMKNAEVLLSDIGFVGFDHNYTDFTNGGIVGKPTKDSIGAVAAYKPLTVNEKDYTLIALAVRGGGYESEWASNFTIGASGQHQGFSQARDQVVTFLEEYVVQQGITGDIKLWVTGYSRGGATANMVAGRINEGGVNLAGCTLKPEDMYAYTFEAPQGAMPSDGIGSKFRNIFNIINPSDPVPKVAPSVWDFKRYGRDFILPSPENYSPVLYETRANDMLLKYNALTSTKQYIVDNFAMKKIEVDAWSVLPGGDPFVSIIDDINNIETQSIFLNDFITLIAKDFLRSRDVYVQNLQVFVRDAFGILNETDPAQIDKLMDSVKKKFSDNWGWLLWEALNPFSSPAENEKNLYKLAAQYLEECLNEAQITNYSQEAFESSVVVICDMLIAAALQNPNLVTTLVENLDGIGQSHYPELCLAWLQSMDSHYTPGGAEGFSSGKYRVIRINCPVDVQVYSSDNNQLVAEITNDMPQEISSIIASINEDGEKVIYLSASEAYRVEITATGEGEVSYTLNEYSPQVGEVNRLTAYYDIPISVGQKLIGEVPAYTQSELDNQEDVFSNTRYKLETNGSELVPSQELAGENAKSAYFSIVVESEDREKGLAFGAGTRQVGRFAKVSAYPNKGNRFLGWYEDGTILVSEELEYRFRVERDTRLVAKFEAVPELTHTVSFDSNGGSAVEPITDVISGTTIVLPIPTYKDHTFLGWKDRETVYTNETPITKDVTLTASWEAINTEPEVTTPEELKDKPIIYKGDGYEVSFVLTNYWGNQFEGMFVLKNTDDKPIENWGLAFAFEHDIKNLWEAKIQTAKNPTYEIKNIGWNQDILPGEVVNIHFMATFDEVIKVPTSYELLGAVHEVKDYQVEFNVLGDWGSGFNGEIMITNLSDKPIEDWQIAFDFNKKITKIWAAQLISHNGSQYVIKNEGYNANIMPNQTIKIGIDGETGNVEQGPTNYKLTQINTVK